jgi:hypothetical protein
MPGDVPILNRELMLGLGGCSKLVVPRGQFHYNWSNYESEEDYIVRLPPSGLAAVCDDWKRIHKKKVLKYYSSRDGDRSSFCLGDAGRQHTSRSLDLLAPGTYNTCCELCEILGFASSRMLKETDHKYMKAEVQSPYSIEVYGGPVQLVRFLGIDGEDHTGRISLRDY